MIDGRTLLLGAAAAVLGRRAMASRLTITRTQPYIDWANSFDDGPELTAELAGDRRTIYLVPESDSEPDLESLIEEFWEAIFDDEVAADDVMFYACTSRCEKLIRKVVPKALRRAAETA